MGKDKAQESLKPVTLADVLATLNLFDTPTPNDEARPWEEGDFIRVSYLPDLINLFLMVLIKSGQEEFRHAGWFTELPSGMSYRLWDQGGHSQAEGEIELFERVV